MAAAGEAAPEEDGADPGGRLRRGRGDDGATLPSVACSQMRRKQARIEASGDAALVASLPPRERTRALQEAMVRRKEERCSGTRCPGCWFPNVGGANHCVCAQMPALRFRRRARFLVYMHPRDWYNAGDDAKIFLNAAPEATQLFVQGRPGDTEALRVALEEAEAPVLLFPDASALTVDAFLELWRGSRGGAAAASGAEPSEKAGGIAAEGEDDLPILSIVVIDGTWNNVKQLLRQFVREIGPKVPHVKLQPTELSVYARTQTRTDGVSSVEAVALLLRAAGEDEDVCRELVRYIQVNNEALRLRKAAGAAEDAEDAEDG